MINFSCTGKQKGYESVLVTKHDKKLKQAFLWNTTEEQATQYARRSVRFTNSVTSFIEVKQMTLELTMEWLNRAPKISFLNSMFTVAPGSIFPPFMTVRFFDDLTSSFSLPSATPLFELQDIRAYIWNWMKGSPSFTGSFQ